MSNGQFQILDRFGWNAAQSASVQRAKVQSALDSGEPLLMPCGETVTIDDVPLVASHALHLVGHGCDITNTGIAVSQFRSAASGTVMLRILSSNSKISNLNFQYDVMGSRAIEIGDATHQSFGTVLDHISVGGNALDGLTILNAQEWTARDCYINGQEAAIRVDNAGADGGDSRIHGGEFNAFAPNGAGLLLLSGGGLGISGYAKFLSCFNHIKVDWRKGGSGGLLVSGSSFEGCRGLLSVDMDGTQPFERMMFSDCTWGNSSLAIAVRNFQSAPWVKQLTILNNTIKVFGTSSVPAIDIGSAAEVLVAGNNIDGTGIAYAGVVMRNPCTGTVGPNYIRNTTGAAVQNLASGVTVVPQF